MLVITSAQQLMAASALVILALGSIHLLYTFRGNKLYPRDTHLERQMHVVAPVLTRRTTMWDAWIGFNASHSLGAMFFGMTYAYLALAHAELLFHSTYLLVLGLGLLVAYLFLAKTYWFFVPLVGVSLSLALYIGAVIAFLR